jgi:Ras GTPase-activating protein-binding protein 1
MVMATPSPQQVGREFVRQYYTVLHEAPEVLHRFYSSGSTFIHGGVDKPGHVEEPLIGQVEIGRKIQQLNFKDCHTKIRQVDSQATIGSAVVVQVSSPLVIIKRSLS